MVTTNKELVRRFFEELFSQGDLTCVAEIAAPTYIEHAVAPFGLDEPGPVDGPSHLRQTAQWLREQFPDVVMTIESMVEEGDLIAARVHSQGTNLGAWARNTRGGVLRRVCDGWDTWICLRMMVLTACSR